MKHSDSNAAPQKAGLPGRVKAGVAGSLVAMAGAAAVIMPGCGKEASVPTRADEAVAAVSTPVPGASPAAGSDRDATLPPRWVPSYPAAQGQEGGTKRETKDKIAGTYLAKTKDDPDKVKDYFDSTLKADGFETDVKSTSTDGNDSTIVTATVNGGKRKLTVTATSEKGVTNLVITYEGAK